MPDIQSLLAATVGPKDLQQQLAYAASCNQTQLCKQNLRLGKDTVAANEEDNKVETDDDANFADTAIGSDSIVHHHVPVLTRQDLDNTQFTHFMQTSYTWTSTPYCFVHLNTELPFCGP